MSEATALVLAAIITTIGSVAAALIGRDKRKHDPADSPKTPNTPSDTVEDIKEVALNVKKRRYKKCKRDFVNPEEIPNAVLEDSSSVREQSEERRQEIKQLRARRKLPFREKTLKRALSVIVALIIVLATLIGVYAVLITGGIAPNPFPTTTASNPPVPASVWLSDLDYLTAKNIHFANSNPKASNGDVFEYGISCANAKSGDGVIKYQLDQEYTRFTGVFTLDYVVRNTSGQGYIVISVDGVEIYTSSRVTRGVDPVKFDLDITGCNILEIRIKAGSSFSVCDMKLYG